MSAAMLDGNAAALREYERQQDRLQVSHDEREHGKVAAILTMLKRDQGAATQYTGLELVSEALSEHQLIDYRPIVDLLAGAIDGCDNLKDAASNLDSAELGEVVKRLMWPYLESVAENHADEHLPANDDEADRADYLRDEARDRAALASMGSD